MAKKTILKLIQRHIAHEKQEADFYRLALKREANPVLQILYKSIMNDSLLHVQMLEMLQAHLQKKESYIGVTTEPLENIRNRIKAEERAKQSISEIIGSARDPVVEMLLTKIIKDEETHATMLQKIARFSLWQSGMRTAKP